MVVADAIKLINNAIKKSQLACHEEENAEWSSLSSSYVECLTTLKENPTLFGNLPTNSLIRALIIAAGCIGNKQTTQKLFEPSGSLLKLAKDALNSCMNHFNFDNIESLFKMQPIDHNALNYSIFHLFVKEATVCISHLNNNEGGCPLSRGPLYRDALIWATMRVHYPVIEDSHDLVHLHPFALQLIEDYRPSIKSAGLRMLKHMGNQILVASWRTTGRADATLELLTTQRSIHAQDVPLLDLTLDCIFLFLRLIEPQKRELWNNKIGDLIFCDLTLEVSLEKRIVILKYIEVLMENMETKVLVHSRRFLKAAETHLLAPRAPSHKPELLKQEYCGFMQTLKLILRFTELAVNCLFPDIIPMIVPMLTAFVDLEWNRKGVSPDSPSISELSYALEEIFQKIVGIDPLFVNNLLSQCTEVVPALAPLVRTLHCPV